MYILCLITPDLINLSIADFLIPFFKSIEVLTFCLCIITSKKFYNILSFIEFRDHTFPI